MKRNQLIALITIVFSIVSLLTFLLFDFPFLFFFLLFPSLLFRGNQQKMETLYCRECGAVLSSSWKACPYCGKRIYQN